MNSIFEPQEIIRQRQAQVLADMRGSRTFPNLGILRIMLGNALISVGQRMRGPLPTLPLAPVHS